MRGIEAYEYYFENFDITENTALQFELINRFLRHILMNYNDKYIDDDIERVIIHMSPLNILHKRLIKELIDDLIYMNETLEEYEICAVLLRLSKRIEEIHFS